jgi:phosphate-selective porin OprO/OprP
MKIALAAAGLSVAWCGQAWADDASEKALAKKVEELQKQLDEVSKRIGDGSSRANDELEQRVAELEKVTKKDKDGLFPYWGNGIRMDSVDGAFKIQIGGRIQSDWTWYQGQTDAEHALGTTIEAGEEFRRARLMMGGTIYSNVAFSAEYDFAGGTSTPRDVWMMLKNIPGGNFLVGNFKVPTGTEELTSDLFTTFLERSQSNAAFAPDYQTGFQLSNTFMDDAYSYQLAFTRNSAANGNSVGNEKGGIYNYTGRIAGRPWSNNDTECPSFVTAGAAANFHNLNGDTVSIAARPENHITPNFINTGSMSADQTRMIEADAGFVTGPLWLFGDFFNEEVSLKQASNVSFQGWQVAAGYFLTGESKPYKASNSTYDRIKPKHNFDGKGGLGAWEIAARYDELDLNDGDIQGGKDKIFTLGLSWYLNPNTRVMLDWVHADNDFNDKSYWINIIEMRFQIDF